MQALQAAITAHPLAPDTTLREVVHDGKVFMEIVSGAVEYNGNNYPPGTHVMLSPVPGFEGQLLFFTSQGAATAANEAGMNLTPENVDFTFVGDTPATNTPDGHLIRINPETGQWEAITVYRAAQLTFGRAHLAPVENPNQSLVQMVHATKIDYDALPGYVTITSKDGSQRVVLPVADFHQLAETGWQSVDMQPTIDRYARYSQSAEVDVNGIIVPITISHNLDQYTITADERYLHDLALHWLYATWLRYQISHPDITFEQYQQEVRQGRGQVVAPVNHGGSKPFIILDPRRGFHFVLADTTDTLPNREQWPNTADDTAVFTAHWAGAHGLTSVYNPNNSIFSSGIESGSQHGFTREQALEISLTSYIMGYGVDPYVNFPATTASGRSFQHGLDLRYERYVADYLVSRHPQASEEERAQMLTDWFDLHRSKDDRDRWWRDIVYNEGHYPNNGLTVTRR